MSIQWGRWSFDNAPLTAEEERHTKNMLRAYQSDGMSEVSESGIRMLFLPFRTTNDSGCDALPLKLPGGAILMFDGRLDNTSELIQQLDVAHHLTEVQVVAACYARWGSRFLSRLVGDWALSLWEPRQRSLLLARDFAGPRHLFYCHDSRGIVWCTALDPLLARSERLLQIEPEYIAGWLGAFPATHLTPFAGFHSVPPSCFVIAREGSLRVREYWNFDSQKEIRYRQDGEYEEHLRCAFTQAVRRRLRSERPIVAELSGGMDSSSIVCFADRLTALAPAELRPVETLSYYDDSEPNWNELPFISRVEQLRGREGLHINLAEMEILRPKYRTGLVPTSLAAGNETSSTGRSVIEYLNSIESRVVLSGIGGDEVMGGVATPLPELADLFVQANVIEFCRQAIRWCLALRQPFAHLVGQVLSTFLPKKLVKTKADPWVNPHFQRRYRDALAGYARRSTLFRPRPSLTMNLSALNNLRRQLACSSLSPELPCEKRYPYLDRDLLEFIYSIPRSQLVRPGQRRSLMRRAFRGIVPDEIIDRKRKAFAVRSPLLAFATNDPLRGDLKEGMLSDLFGYVDFRRLAKTIEIARQGGEAPMAALVRTITLEHWLRHLSKLNAIELNQRVGGGKTMPKSKKGWHRVTADTYW